MLFSKAVIAVAMAVAMTFAAVVVDYYTYLYIQHGWDTRVQYNLEFDSIVI